MKKKTSIVRKESNRARSAGSSAATLLADQHQNWIKLVKESGMKLRAACKVVVNTETWKTRSLPTIEVCRPPSRKYLPLMMPDGSWKFETDKERDEVLALLVS